MQKLFESIIDLATIIHKQHRIYTDYILRTFISTL